MDNVDGQHRCQRVAPKGQRLRIERQEDLKDLISHIRMISTDTGRWAQGPLIKQCLSPAQAPVQKQQQSQAACSSACLTRSEWWRHWVPYWKWLGSSGPQSRPAAWNRKTHTGQSGLRVLTVQAVRAPTQLHWICQGQAHRAHRAPPRGILTCGIPQLCWQLRSLSHHLWAPTRKLLINHGVW